MESTRHYFKIFVLITDFLLIGLACKLAYLIRFGELGGYGDSYLSFFIIFNLAWISSALFNNVYNANSLFNFKVFMGNFFYTLFIQAFIISVYIISVKAHYFSRLFLGYSYGFSILAMVGFRYALVQAYKYYRSKSYLDRKIVIVGSGRSADDLYNFFSTNNTSSIYRFLENLDPNLPEAEYQLMLDEHIGELKELCLSEGINEIYCSIPLNSVSMIEDVSRFSDDNFIHFRIVTNFSLLNDKRVNVDFFGQTPIITLRKEPLKILINRVLKRAFDIAFSLAVILLIFPILFPIIALLIKLESDGPVIFKQPRSGRKNQKFICFKFRTMVANSGEFKQATKNDARITKVGAFLRKTSLDEFPQFINVLLGDMSVVGPRPHPLKLTEEYSQLIDKYLFRHFITPGITGHAQVNGYRGETTQPEQMKKRVELDTWYIENWSFFLDLKIVFLTVWNVFKGEENAY